MKTETLFVGAVLLGLITQATGFTDVNAQISIGLGLLWCVLSSAE